MSGEAVVLRTAGISKKFGSLEVSRDISLTLPVGARHALIGPNGAGKTTLINLITGRLKPDAGTITLAGDDVTTLPAAARVRRGLTRTFQINTLFPGLTPIESVLLAVCERKGEAGQFWRRLTGHAEAVDAAIAALAERGVRKAVKLAVSVPSHTPLMREAADALAARIAATPLRLPSLPLVHNVDAGIATDLDALKSALVRQLYLPVRWTDCVQQMIAAGAIRFVECGPGKVLAGLIKRIDRGVESKSLGSVADFEDALNGWGER